MEGREQFSEQRKKIEERLFGITKDLDRKDPKYLEAIQQAEHAFNELDDKQKSLITGRKPGKTAKYKSMLSRTRNNEAPGLAGGGSMPGQKERLEAILSKMKRSEPVKSSVPQESEDVFDSMFGGKEEKLIQEVRPSNDDNKREKSKVIKKQLSDRMTPLSREQAYYAKLAKERKARK